MNGAIHPAAAEQGAVGGIDDGVHLEGGDIPEVDRDPALFPGRFHTSCVAT